MSRTTTTTKIDTETFTYLSETRDSAGLLLAEGRWTITVDKPTAKILEVVFYDGTTSAVASVQQCSEEISAMLEMDGMVCDIQGRVFDKHQRDFVMSRMHYGSRDYIVRDDASNKVWMDCYLLADGFGDLGSYREAERLGFDWSHVRDSSPYAIGRIAEKLRYTHGI